MKYTHRIASTVVALLLMLATVAVAKPLDVARSVGQISSSNPLPVTLGSSSVTVTETSYGAYYDAIGTAPGPPVVNPANDIFRINGSATKTVYVHEMNCTVIATTSANITLQIAKRSTAGAGMVTIGSAIVPRDSESAAATATVVTHVDNAGYTPGTLVGYVWIGRVQMPAAATTGTAQTVPVTVRFDPPIELHGTAESLSWYLPAASPAGSVHYSTVSFSEL